MYLTEKHIINKNHSFYNECDLLCFKSKNLYNQALYNVRQYFFENNKYLNYYKNFHITKQQESYIQLPRKVSNQTLKMVDRNFKSFFSLLKLKNKNQYKEKIKIPKYLDKINGRYIIIYEKQSLSFKEFKKTGNIKLSQSDILINTKIKDFESIKEVRIIPKNNHYVIEVIYKQQETQLKPDNNKYLGIDLGINNLATCGSNDKGFKPFIINGRPLKNINHYYNKKLVYYKSKLEKENKLKTSERIKKLTNKRNNKINDYLHKSSKILVNQLVSNNINTLVIGNNKNWKQDINIGKRNNQNFVQIPHNTFINMLIYKCKLEGINVILQEESYTSKCSFIDNEKICKHDKYVGKRIKRGLFKTLEGKLINADLNGSLNIIKKAIPNTFVDGIEGLAVNPIKLEIGL